MTSTSAAPARVDILILGAGWLYQFLPPLLSLESLDHAATSTTGRDGTLKFTFDPSSSDTTQYTRLPPARTVLITFPLRGASATDALISAYSRTHPSASPRYILLGSTGEYKAPSWQDHTSEPSDPHSDRWTAEERLISLSGCVLNLAGLWGEAVRDGRIWERAVPTTKEGLKAKQSVHFVHGADVGRAIIAAHKKLQEQRESSVSRWLLTDGRVYDWWTLVWENAEQLDQRLTMDQRQRGGYRQWIAECMREDGVRALPRDGDILGRRLDSRAFWEWTGRAPVERGFSMDNITEASPKGTL